MIKRSLILAFTVVLLIPCNAQHASSNATQWHTKDIHIRDPFIFADTVSEIYYLYAQLSNEEKRGVKVYTSKDLEIWSGPFPVYYVEDDSWAKEYIWAPEVITIKANITYLQRSLPVTHWLVP